MEHLDDQERQQVWANIKDALFNDHIDQFRAEFLELHPYDQARIFEGRDEDVRLQIYTYLSPEEVADFMEHIDYEEIEPFFSEMDPTFAAQVFAEMSADDAVDIFNELDKDKVASFLTIMDEEAADEIKDLLHYEEKTAGSIMTTEYVVVNATMTIKEAMVHLRTEAPDAETIYYTYVIDEDKRLAGVISLRDLIISEEDWLIADVMNERVVSVSVGDDQEEVARMVRDYDFLALPVVDFQDHLLGIITVDDIMDVMEEEASDDYSKFAAISDVDSPDDNAFSSAKKRLPWLIILLFLGSLTASLIGRFEETLDKVAILAIFIPLIAGMGGNTGTQALAVAVRGIATGEFEKQGKIKMMMREAGTGLISGIVCGVLMMLIVYIWQGNFFLGVLVGLSILLTLIVATLAGSLVPLIMHRLNVDPAVASGPFITTLNDLISILIYFGMATAFMNLLI
ncbi:magnesium transporter [Halobacillus sp. ACCC02827]|uniref:magnesium transporter n=1 Tax=Bacillaceae TaxID=186817 RepID=UPI0002A4E892|nr:MULTISPECIES: magnesium transporter [Bacillaceae]ELK45188.1 magnesium MgtE family transporter [Halobacillus sp. BAB-2008]QHT46055.1 magnesium transporter [Bacillus sp. SB49]WJE16870.1 magnesium transporter [Halobacillus sp. ACCC02827]